MHGLLHVKAMKTLCKLISPRGAVRMINIQNTMVTIVMSCFAAFSHVLELLLLEGGTRNFDKSRRRILEPTPLSQVQAAEGGEQHVREEDPDQKVVIGVSQDETNSSFVLLKTSEMDESVASLQTSEDVFASVIDKALTNHLQTTQYILVMIQSTLTQEFSL